MFPVRRWCVFMRFQLVLPVRVTLTLSGGSDEIYFLLISASAVQRGTLENRKTIEKLKYGGSLTSTCGLDHCLCSDLRDRFMCVCSATVNSDPIFCTCRETAKFLSVLTRKLQIHVFLICFKFLSCVCVCDACICEHVLAQCSAPRLPLSVWTVPRCLRSCLSFPTSWRVTAGVMSLSLSLTDDKSIYLAVGPST